MESAERSRPNQAQQLALSLQELRQHIAPFLNSKDVYACCLVSRQWHQDWSPFFWRDAIRRIPKDLSRFGHLIKNLDLKFSSHPADTLAGIRNHCLDLRSLRLVGNGCTQLEFEAGVLGIHSASPSSPTTLKANQETMVEVVSRDLMDNPYRPTLERNGFLSNSLHTLNLAMPPTVCDVILPRLIQARRAGLLQGLRSFRMGQVIIFYTCIDVEPTVPCTLQISTVIEFLDSFPGLTSFSSMDIAISDDIGVDISKLTISLPTTDRALLAYRQIQEYPNIVKLHISPQTPQGFELLASKMPNVVDLALHPRGSANLLPLILQHYPGLTSLTISMEDHDRAYDRVDEDSDLENLDKYKDWIQLFQGLPNLEQFKSRLVGLPYVLFKTIAQSCPKLKSFTAIEQTTSLRGVQYLLRHSTTLKALVLSEMCYTNFFNDNGQLWKAPLEILHLEDVVLAEDPEHNIFRNRIRQLTRLKSLKIGYAGRMSVQSILDPDDCRAAEAEKRSLRSKTGDDEEGWEVIDGITHCSNDDGTSGSDIAVVPEAHYPCLEELELEDFPKVPNQGVYWRMVDIMPRLISMKLDKDFSEEDILKMRRRVA